eukprot:363761-Chlamydomonas_euryale.AAC.25
MVCVRLRLSAWQPCRRRPCRHRSGGPGRVRVGQFRQHWALPCNAGAAATVGQLAMERPAGCQVLGFVHERSAAFLAHTGPHHHCVHTVSRRAWRRDDIWVTPCCKPHAMRRQRQHRLTGLNPMREVRVVRVGGPCRKLRLDERLLAVVLFTRQLACRW